MTINKALFIIKVVDRKTSQVEGYLHIAQTLCSNPDGARTFWTRDEARLHAEPWKRPGRIVRTVKQYSEARHYR